MTSEEYITTVVIKNKSVQIGIDDYGQCYFFEFTDDNGEVQSIGCGTYNTDYLEEVYGYFDPKGTFISLEGIDAWNERIEAMKVHRDMCTNPKIRETLDKQIEHMINDSYELYDFPKMYQEFHDSLLTD